MTRPLNVLIIGCGEIAGRTDLARGGGTPPMTHAGAFAADDRFALAGCVDTDMALASGFAKAWRFPRSFNDLNAALTKPPNGGWEVISICTPDATHGEILEQVLASAPRIVFCEKPLDTDIDRARRIVRAYRAAGVALAVNHLRRWDPAVASFRDELADGAWGAVHTVFGLYTKGLWHNGSHMIDLVTNLFGPVIPERALGLRDDGAPGDPTIDVRLRLHDGTPVTLMGSDQRSYPVFELTTVCANGAFSMEQGGFAWRVRHAGASPEFPGHRHLSGGERRTGQIDGAMRAAVANLAAHLDDGAPLACDGDCALATLECCAKIAELAWAAR